MNKTTHLLGGFAAAYLLDKFAGMPLDFVHTATVVYAATIPDFDTPNSAANKPTAMLPFGLGELEFLQPLNAAAGGIGDFLSTAVKHRGPLHYPLTYAVLYGVWWIIANSNRAAWLPVTEQVIHYARLATHWLPLIGAGILSHLLLDAITVKGIAPLAPLSFKKLPTLKIKTGTWQEGAVQSALGLGLFFSINEGLRMTIAQVGIFVIMCAVAIGAVGIVVSMLKGMLRLAATLAVIAGIGGIVYYFMK